MSALILRWPLTLALAGAALLAPPAWTRPACSPAAVRAHVRLAMAVPEPEPEDERDERPIDASTSGEDEPPSVWDMSQLAQRISSVQEGDELTRRLEGLEQAWVLVFDADSEEEAVYSMEMHEGQEGRHVVLAFECSTEAKIYAEALRDEEDLYEGEASVQALDVAALVITSREADFRVGVVFKGDLEMSANDALRSVQSFVSSARPEAERVNLSITMVPDHVFAGRTSAEFLDPSDEPIWVLVHDAGTADAQYFQMSLNGTSSVVCFKDLESAERCAHALQSKGTSGTAARSILLEDLLDQICDDETEVCLVDEVVETMVEGDGSGELPGPGIIAADSSDQVLGSFPAEPAEAARETSAVPRDVRAMLNRIYASEGGEADAGEGEGGGAGPPLP